MARSSFRGGRRAVLAAIVGTLVLTAPQRIRLPDPSGSQDDGARPHAIAASLRQRHPVSLAAADYVRVTIDFIGIDLAAALVGADGTVLSQTNFRQPDHIRLSAIAPTAGTHYVEVWALDPKPAFGRYALRIDEIRHQAGPNETDRVAAAQLVIDADALVTNWNNDTTAAALEHYRAALNRFTGASDSQGEALAARQLGELLLALGRPDQALPLFVDAQRLVPDHVDVVAACAALDGAARASLDLGKMAQATDFAQRELSLSRAAINNRREADALNVLGDIDAFSGRTRESLIRYRQALKISEDLRDRRRQAHALLNLGYSYGDFSQITDAQKHYEAALAVSTPVDDWRAQGRALTALGQLHGNVGENDRALARFREALPIHERLGDAFGLGSTLLGIALVHFRSGDSEGATAYQLRAVDLFRGAKNQTGEATSLLNLGRSLASLGRHLEALDRYAVALKLFRAGSDRRLQARVLQSMGDVYGQLGEFKTALANYEESRQLANAVGDSRGEAYALNGIGALLSNQGQFAKATVVLGQALRLGQQSRNRLAESFSLYNLAKTEEAQGRLDTALAKIRESIAIAETLRGDVSSLDLRASYLASVRDRHELEIDLLMRIHERDPSSNTPALAFEISEQTRARSFLDRLAQARGRIREGVAPALLEREDSIQRSLNETAQRLAKVRSDPAHAAEIAALNAEVDRLTSKYRDIEAQIRAESPRYASLTQSRSVTLQDVQRLALDDQSVLLQYFLGARQSYVWAVTRDTVAVRTLPPRPEIERIAQLYRSSLIASATSPRDRSVGGLTRLKNSGELKDAGRELSATILDPVAPLIANRRVLIVADGILQAVPFAALEDPNSKPSPLVVNHEVINLPSASTLMLIRSEWKRERHWKQVVKVFADPVYEQDDPRMQPATVTATRRVPQAETQVAQASRGGEVAGNIRMARLNGSRKEAQSIAAVAAPASIALDFDANRTAALDATLGNYRIVHFAVHGIVDDARPELSGIALSMFDRGGQPQDGFVRLHDIYNLQIPADLVVLSACSTALGREVPGEGLTGLVRGFMYAGARRVLASLWEVDDIATSELMTRFYRNMFEKKLSPPAALRSAQVELLTSSKWNAPFYWAPFVLMGEWGQ
jgi:CHAT domain-containing protein/tetratricopeptide (TPR) repeat protein